MQSFETRRLSIRAFTAGDWAGIQELAKDKESSQGANYDHAWPTSEDGCKGMADYLSNNRGAYWAVCLKDDGRLIGLIKLSPEDDRRHELGHVFHTRFSGGDYDAEAIGRMMDHAFEHVDIRSIVAKNAEEWAGQLAPLKKLGMKVTGRGKGSFHTDPSGKPIAFIGCTMEITREEWERRAGKAPD